MVSEPTRRMSLGIAVAVVLAALLAPGVLAQPGTQTENEPNDTPENATLVAPGTTVTGEIAARDGNASDSDTDWFAVAAEDGQNVTVEFTAGNESERLLVFLASADRLRNASEGPENVSAENVTDVSEGLGDATFASSGSTVQLRTTAQRSGVYLIGVTGLEGEYSFVVETESEGPPANATTATEANATTEPSRETPTATAEEPTTGGTPTPEGDASEQTTAGDSGETTDASGPGFGLLAALAALLAVASLAVRRR